MEEHLVDSGEGLIYLFIMAKSEAAMFMLLQNHVTVQAITIFAKRVNEPLDGISNKIK